MEMILSSSNGRHTLDASDLKDSLFTNPLASSTKGTGKKLAIVNKVDDKGNVVTDIHVLVNTNRNSKALPRVAYRGTNLAEAINKYNSLP